MLSAGLLSVIGSVVDHRVQLPADDIRALLAGAASAVLKAELPGTGGHLGPPRLVADLRSRYRGYTKRY